MSNVGRQTVYPPEQWAVAKALFLCGVAPTECARRAEVPVDALRKRSERENWLVLRAHLAELKVPHGKQLEGDKALEMLSTQLKSLLANDLHRSVHTLARCRHAGTVSAVSERASAQRTLISNASDLFGWKQQAIASTVNIAMLSGESYGRSDKPSVTVSSVSDVSQPSAL